MRGSGWCAAFLALAALLTLQRVSCASESAGRTWKEAVADRLDRQEYATPAPLIGILTQPFAHKGRKSDEQTVSGPLVSWVESAGGRAVPIR